MSFLTKNKQANKNYEDSQNYALFSILRAFKNTKRAFKYTKTKSSGMVFVIYIYIYIYI